MSLVLPRWSGGVNGVRRLASLVLVGGRGRRPVRDVRIYIALVVVRSLVLLLLGMLRITMVRG
jgi:hypothetical protein